MNTPLHTAFEKMTNEELEAVFGFVTDRTKGKTARLWVIESRVKEVLKKRGLSASSPRISGGEDVKRMFDAIIRVDKFNMFHAIEDCPWEDDGKRKRTPEEERAFSYAARARIGHDEGFGDMAEEAIRTGDIQFFEMAIKVLETSKKSRSMLTKHVKVIIGIYHNLEVAGKSAPTKGELKSLVIGQFEADGDKAYPFNSKQWETVFKRAGLDHLDQERPGSVKSEAASEADSREARRGLNP